MFPVTMNFVTKEGISTRVTLNIFAPDRLAAEFAAIQEIKSQNIFANSIRITYRLAVQ